MTTMPRKEQLLDLLRSKKKLSNDSMQQFLYCSPATLRRVLIELETEGLIRRFRGGAMIEIGSNQEVLPQYRDHVLIEEKKHIAEIASNFIGRGMCLFMDASSTTKAMVPFIHNIPNLVIVTNGLGLAHELINKTSYSSKIYLVGGELIRDAESIVKEFSLPYLHQFNFDLCLFSTTGFDTHAIYEANYYQAKFKRHLIHLAKKSIYLSDHTKYSHQHPFIVTSMNKIDVIISDKKNDELEKASLSLDIEFLY
ncbi:DeoR/GlpR transcriptional regulator [Atopobacter sp. AH10]|uniref:DeoR/GlpR family DNA-binding transcription regulator n=1 Tax=Atopobacter sp. AH10 TaxID=2315861 RepID=UPI000EF1F055|nr:DeoR/GlpR family DNA-binding transcription regulator [Atopobacter sp. AH10]RLK62837.1 DeoR/GlpR transcriptional regulator [Atopobacter sp. AH10]